MAIEAKPVGQSTKEPVLRDTRINLCETRAELEFIRRAAETTQKSLTEFVLESAAIAAERALADRREFSLDSAGQVGHENAPMRTKKVFPAIQFQS